MLQFKFVDYHSHKKEHDQFVIKALDLKERMERGSLILTMEIYYYLAHWLVNHILVTDKRYSNNFNENGLY